MIKQQDLENLRKIANFEDTHDMDTFNRGWRCSHVNAWGATLASLRIKGYIKQVAHTNAYTGYRLSELGRKVLADADEKDSQPIPDTGLTISDNLFGDIIGHDDVKELLTACLRAEKPVHVLLSGPPALAKSLFLWDIERAAGERSIWLVGSATSKAGLWDVIAERQPQILLIDELDKMTAADTAALLSIMEGGRLVRVKRGRQLNISNQLRAVAASNRLHLLSPELKSRFVIRKLVSYSRDDYINVVKGVLVKNEGLDAETAAEIAGRLDGVSLDVRDAVKVARLTPQLGVEKAINLALRGGQE